MEVLTWAVKHPSALLHGLLQHGPDQDHLLHPDDQEGLQEGAVVAITAKKLQYIVSLSLKLSRLFILVL